MRSPCCRSRIYIRSGRYWEHELNLFPPTAPIRIFARRQATEGPAFRKQALLIIKRDTNVKLVEPPSCRSASTIIFIGRNSRGNWGAQEQNGRYGVVFVNRAQAFKYALFENGRHPETIVELSREIELDMGGKLAASVRIAGARRVAGQAGWHRPGGPDDSASFRSKPRAGRRYHDRPHAPVRSA